MSGELQMYWVAAAELNCGSKKLPGEVSGQRTLTTAAQQLRAGYVAVYLKGHCADFVMLNSNGPHLCLGRLASKERDASH